VNPFFFVHWLAVLFDGGVGGKKSMWRMSGDVSSFEDVLRAADDNEPLSQYAGPGGWNDPGEEPKRRKTCGSELCSSFKDILIGSSPNSTLAITPAQSRTQFNLWCVMASPLLIGANVLTMSPYDRQTYSNTEMLAVSEDALGVQGRRFVGSNLHLNGTVVPGTNVWARRLSDSAASFAVVFVNTGSAAAAVVCDQMCLRQIGVTRGFDVRDLWAHTDLGTFSSTFAADVDGDGASRAFKFTQR